LINIHFDEILDEEEQERKNYRKAIKEIIHSHQTNKSKTKSENETVLFISDS